MEWKNCSSYSRGQKDRTPTAWEIKAEDIRICVHRHIHYPKDQWLLSCAPFYDLYELPYTDVDQAKGAALNMVIIKLRDAAEAFSH